MAHTTLSVMVNAGYSGLVILGGSMARPGGAVDPPPVDVGPLRDVITVALGFAMGVLSGLFGVGGGVISQPGMRLLGIEPIIVIGTALPVIIPGAASGTRRYWREGLIQWPAVLATVPAGLLAAIGGSAASEHVPGDGHLLQLITAALLLLSSYRMARVSPSLPADEPLAETDAPEAPTRAPEGTGSIGRCVGIGVIAGGLSGLLGIGGGVIMVPAFVYFVRMEVKAAIATSLVCVGLFAIPGAVTHALLGHVDWRVAAALIVGVIPGARVGASLAIRASDRRLRVTVATFLAITAVIYAAAEITALL